MRSTKSLDGWFAHGRIGAWRWRALAKDALECAPVHSQTLRRGRYIAATLLMDAHDMLPTRAIEPKRHVRYRWQLGRSVKQCIDQIARTR